MLTLIASPVWRQYAAVVIASLTIVHSGMHLAWTSPVLVMLKQTNQTILNNPPTIDEEAWIVSVNLLVGASAVLFTGTLVNFLGRKRLVLFMAVPRVAMCLLFLFASEVWMILLGRAVGGVVDLMSLSAVSAYTAEVVGKQIRGASGTVTQILSAIGMMIMFAVAPFVSYLAVNVMMTCIVVVTYIPIFFIPESPYFLYSKGRLQDAFDALTTLRGCEVAAREEMQEYALLKAGVSNVMKINTRSLLRDRVVLRTFGLVILLSFLSSFTGSNAVNFYLQTIFETTQTYISSEISSLIIGVIQLLACFCTFFLTDRFGRKPILCISLISLAIGMVGLGTFFMLFENGHEIVGFLNFLPLLSVIVAVYGNNAGMGSLFWIVVTELFEERVRPYGVSCGIQVASIFTFGLIFCFPVLANAIGSAILFYIFAGCCIVLCSVIYFFVPETKGRTFAEIQTALGRKDLMK